MTNNSLIVCKVEEGTRSATSFPALASVLKKIDEFVFAAFGEAGTRSDRRAIGAGLVERSDCMLARYCGGKQARFQKHVDNTQADGRKLAVVLYFNEGEGWDVGR